MNDTVAMSYRIYDPSVAGLGWLQSDQNLMRQYANMWVVAIPGQVIAFGKDADLVQQQAEDALGLGPDTPERVLVSIIPDPDGEWPHG